MDDPIDKSWEVAQLVKMTNKKGVLSSALLCILSRKCQRLLISYKALVWSPQKLQGSERNTGNISKEN